MSILDNLRRAFGFDSEPDDTLYCDDTPADSTDAAPQQQAAPAPEAAPQPGGEDAAPGPTEAEAIAADMLAEVVEIFNSFQPEFIARCLDMERQRRLIASSLTPALCGRLSAIASAERARIEAEAAGERATLDSDIRQLRERNAELEKRREAFKDEQLSATRQKRALQERIHDLESQCTQLAADKEQLELENRSMANKLRVASVETPTRPRDTAPDPEAIKERDGRIAALTADLDASKADLARAKADLDTAQATLTATGAERDELREQVKTLEQIASHAEKFADIIDKKDARIAEMKTRIKELTDATRRIETLETENKSLRDTIEANLFEHATEMSGLRRELNEMKQAKPRRGRPRKERPAKAQAPETDAAPGAPHISAIDELIEGSEWLVAPTPDEIRGETPDSPADDFGYHAPLRAHAPADDSNQLTLF